jgi:membrane-bound lytic murein transglycosylase D
MQYEHKRGMMKYLFFCLLLMNAIPLFGRSEVEAINLSLQSIQCEESLLDTEALDHTLDNYRGTIAPLYKRYQATTKEYSRIEAKFIEANIPLFFSLIPYSESKFNPSMHGYGTAGLWQFGKQSAKNFGLTVKKGDDERLDINKSNDAVIRYIKYLKREFGSWYLADLAYAMGEGTLQRLIQKNGSKKISVLFKDPHFPSGAKAHFAKTLLLDAKIHYTQSNEEEKGE